MKTIGALMILLVCWSAAHAQSIDDRAAAAGWTAQHEPLCSTLNSSSPMTSFYWEIGDGNPDDTRSGSVGPGAPVNSDSMNIASASKWLYAAYVAEKFGGVLSAYDIRFLTMSSGYVGMGPDQCNPTTSTGPETVNQCLAHGTNSDYTPARDGYWIYNSGHFENHAVYAGIGSSGNVIDLGSDNETALATEMTTTLHHVFLFSQPLLAGGVVTTPARYAAFFAGYPAGPSADARPAGHQREVHQ